VLKRLGVEGLMNGVQGMGIGDILLILIEFIIKTIISFE